MTACVPGPSLSVRERLQRMGVRTWAPSRVPEEDPGARAPLESLRGARIVTCDSGSYLRIDRCLDTEVGAAFAAWAAAAVEHGTALGRSLPAQGIDYRRALFLDTETTGLGGAGCLVFLIGGIHLQGDEAWLTQFFMREPCEERAVMEAFLDFIEAFPLLVSYNGRAFDARALADRCVMAGLPESVSRLDDMPHLDMLFPVRRIFATTLGDCRLVTLEREVLQRLRGPDIPSQEIPAVYYEFARSGRTSGVRQVIEHNAHDLITLVMLAARVLGMVEGSAGHACGTEPMVGLGRLLVDSGRTERGEEALRAALRSNVPETRYMARKHLATLLKKRGAHEEAATIWQVMVDENTLKELHSHTELAKYHEHCRRDCRAALQVVEGALRVRMSLLCSPRELDELQHRLGRLERRLNLADTVRDSL